MAFKVVETALAEITPYEKNARNIPDIAVEKVAMSIEEFGWKQPIVVDKNGIIIVGHTRYMAAEKMGLKKVPVHTAVDLTAEQVRAYRLADNRTHQETDWNFGLLSTELSDLLELNFETEKIGFSDDEIERIIAVGANGFEPNYDPETAPPGMSADDIVKAAADLRERYAGGERDTREIICPACAHEFEITS